MIRFEKTSLDGVYKIISKSHKDENGVFSKFYEKENYKKCGIDFSVTEEYVISERKGVFRGIHFQFPDWQRKIISVISGRLFLVVVNLDKKSDQLGKSENFELHSSELQSLFIPEKYGIATISLEDNTIFCVSNEGKYNPKSSTGIRYNDEILNIEWPLNKLDVMEKDCALMSFSEYLEKENR